MENCWFQVFLYWRYMFLALFIFFGQYSHSYFNVVGWGLKRAFQRYIISPKRTYGLKVMAKILNWAQNDLWAAMCPYKSIQVRRIFVFYIFVRYNTCTRILIIIIRNFIRILVVIILFYYFQIIFLKKIYF